VIAGASQRRALLGCVPQDPLTSSLESTPVSLPSRLSPSRAKDYVQCPRLFYYKTVLGLPTPQTLATAKGTLAHLAFEHLFDHARDERQAEVALAYLEPGWSTMVSPVKARDEVDPDSIEAHLRDEAGLWRDLIEEGSTREQKVLDQARDYSCLAPSGSEVEAKLLGQTAEAVRSYFEIERPWNFDPVGRELHLEATIEDVTLHGFIDRLDRYETSTGEERWIISDYKTGKLPRAQYLDEAFFAMKVYAVLLAATEQVTPHSLRLLYVGAKRPEAVQVLEVDEALLERTRRTMVRLWEEISQAALDGVWETKTGPLCNWCHFQPQCPAFS
jgi:putative RecB family exonuclease